MSRAAPSARASVAVLWIAGAVAFVGIVDVTFRPPRHLLLFGISNGSLYGLAALGLILIYRSHRIINFASIAIGSLPAVSVTLLQVSHDLPYGAALLLAVGGGVVLGGLVELVVVRRFTGLPRLVAMIATLAVAQVIALVSERVAAQILGDRTVPSKLPTPWSALKWLDGRGTPLVTGDDVAAVVVLAATAATLIAFLHRTRAGITLRASAENCDRVALLGAPIARLHTVVWMIAGGLSAAAVFLRIPLVGVPVDPTLGPEVLLAVLAAAAVARFDSIPVAVATGIGIGIMEQVSVSRIGSADLSSAMILVLLVAALLLRRAPEAGVDLEERSSWRIVSEPRQVPIDARGWPEVRRARWTFLGVGAAAALVAPLLVSDGQVGKLTLIPITAILGISLVVLTGWAGQVSLGQFAFAGVGGGVAGGLAANQSADFFVALAAGIVAGTAVAALVGLPSARLRGLYFAVTTLALAAAMEFYVLERGYPIHRLLLPHGEAPRVRRPSLYGVVDLTSDRRFYVVTLIALVAAVWLAHGFRHSRSGRVVLAARDNPVAAASVGVHVFSARLAAFALSGALAGAAGVLLVYQQGSVDPGSFGVAPSLQLFLLTVLGGITTPLGAVLGAVLLKSVEFFVEPHLSSASLLFEGPLLLIVLLVNPGGLGAVVETRRMRLVARAQARREARAIDTPGREPRAGSSAPDALVGEGV